MYSTRVKIGGGGGGGWVHWRSHFARVTQGWYRLRNPGNSCGSEYDGTLGKEAASFHWIRPWSRDEIFPLDMSGIGIGNTLLLVKFTAPNISCILMHTYRKESLMYHRVTSTHTPKHQTHCRCSGLSQNPEIHLPAVSPSGQHRPIGAMRHKLT